MHNYDLFKNVLSYWGIQLNRIHTDVDIAGSPERCELRFVIEDNEGRFFIIEKIFDEDVDHKLKIIHILEYLFQKKHSFIVPYLKNNDKDDITYFNYSYWQLSPFIDGVPLDRPAYVFDQWRGRLLADFLIELRQKSENTPYVNQDNRFSIKRYIYTLCENISTYEPALKTDIVPVLRFLEERFMDIHDNLPVAFCHGDYHPLNIIWSDNGINAVIDWEFLGYKPEIYDMANLIGCIGIEDPEGLAGELVRDFIAEIKQAGFISDISWQCLPEFIVALRFAWLAEWLRHQDREMIELETVYIKLLINHQDLFKDMILL